jgi:hypothetical protein
VSNHQRGILLGWGISFEVGRVKYCQASPYKVPIPGIRSKFYFGWNFKGNMDLSDLYFDREVKVSRVPQL